MVLLMRRIFSIIVVASIFFLTAGESLAILNPPQPPSAPSAPTPPDVPPPFKLPKTALRITDELYKLPSVPDPQTGQLVEAYAIVHKKDKFRTASAHRSGQARVKSACYGFFASGAKWRTVEPWVVNASGSGLMDSFVLSNLSANIAKWEDATDGLLGNGGLNVLGDGSMTSAPLSVDTVSPDNVNEVYFGPIDDPNTIAVTVVWGYFSGPSSLRRLIEWDQIYSTNFSWSATGEAGKMDFENISTHELGHSVGLKDIYTSSCADETMYGYATEGETKKRDLNTGDITGMNILY